MYEIDDEYTAIAENKLDLKPIKTTQFPLFSLLFLVVAFFCTSIEIHVFPQNPANITCMEVFSTNGTGREHPADVFAYPESNFRYRFWREKSEEEILTERIINFDFYHGISTLNELSYLTGVRAQSIREEEFPPIFGRTHRHNHFIGWIGPWEFPL